MLLLLISVCAYEDSIEIACSAALVKAECFILQYVGRVSILRTAVGPVDTDDKMHV